MIVLIQGKTLTPGDLGINIRDEQGRLFDPTAIQYSIFHVDNDGVRTLASAPKMVPARAGLGIYFIAMTIPAVWDGRFDLVWYLTQYPTSNESTVFEEFRVERIDPSTTSFEAPSVLMTSKPGINRRTAEAIMMVRELLSDQNPERNYHFRPPTAGKVVAEFNQRVGFIWEDSTISRFLRLSIQKLNTGNPMNLTHYRIEDAPLAWVDAAAVGAAASCLTAEAARWASEEFSYSLNGVSLDINKASSYQSLGASLNQEFTEWLPLITANRPCVAGLRQNRWLLG